MNSATEYRRNHSDGHLREDCKIKPLQGLPECVSPLLTEIHVLHFHVPTAQLHLRESLAGFLISEDTRTGEGECAMHRSINLPSAAVSLMESWNNKVLYQS